MGGAADAGEGLEMAVIGGEAAEATGDIAAATGADAVAAASITEIAAEGAAAGAAAVASNTAIDVGVAEAAAVPFDIETFGAAAGIAAGVGAATGAAAAGGILAAVIPAFIAAHTQAPSASLLTGSQETASIAALAKGASSKPSVKPILAMAKKAVAEGRPLYSVYTGSKTILVSQLSTNGLAKAIISYRANNDAYSSLPAPVLTAMGLNPLLSKGRLPTGQSITNLNVSLASDIVANTKAYQASGATANALLAAKQLASDKTALTSAQQTLADAASAQTAGQQKLDSSKVKLAADQTAVLSAQTNAKNAVKNASTFNQSLQQSVHQQYINQYANAVDTGRATNTAINLTGLINPTAVYNQYAVKGTSVVAPTTSLANSGITFKNGQPVISSNLQLTAIKNINPALSALSTTGGQVNQKPVAVA